MLICRGFVFAHLQKTGGEWLREVIAQHAPELMMDQPAAKTQFQRKHGALSLLPERYRELPVFIAVRNPWDWHVSWFHYLRGGPEQHYRRKWVARDNRLFTRISEDFTADFDRSMRNLYLHPLRDDDPPLLHRLRKVYVDLETFHLRRILGDTEPTAYGDQATLGPDFLAFLEQVGIPAPGALQDALLKPPTRVNASVRTHYTEYYSDLVRLVIEDRARGLIERFGYTFDQVRDVS